MPRLPVVSGRRAVAAFARAGWQPVRQHGSHVILVKAGREEILTVPLHPELRPGTLRSLLRAARLDPEDFRRLL